MYNVFIGLFKISQVLVLSFCEENKILLRRALKHTQSHFRELSTFSSIT